MVRTVDAFVKGFTQTELAEREWRRPPDELPPDGWAAVSVVPYLQHIAETGQYPLFVRAVIEAEDFPDPDKEFGWQLDRVLDGLAAAIH